jgi:hypothetical protein
MRDKNAQAEYLESRARSTRVSRDGDDRGSKSKRSADAWLRGKVGIKSGNRLIESVDESKRWR